MLLEIDVRLDYATKDLQTVLLQIEAAEGPDQRVVKSALDIEAPEFFVRVPADEGVGVRSWAQVRNRLACTYSAEVAIERPAADISALEQVPVHLLPGEAVKFLMPSRFCQSDQFEPFVMAEFGSLSGGPRVAVMRDWIEANIAYVHGTSNPRTTVVDTFVQRQGICRDFAHLMVTLARASQIPARMVSVYAPKVEPPDFHAVAEVYLAGDWHLIDATGMAAADTMARIGVGRDAADIAFMVVYGPSELSEQSVSVRFVPS